MDRPICIIVFALISFCIPSFFSLPATAQEEACDPAIWESINARAHLQANYENVVNQSFVFKPDSILEYSCFGMWVSEVGDTSGQIFSENPAWDVNPPISLPDHLTEAVIDPLAGWLDANFDHAYLGGRDGTGVTNSGCSLMHDVWQVAKCRNFMEDGIDGFFSFEELADIGEIRLLPEACDTPPDWSTLIDVAYADTPWWPDYADPTIGSYMGIADRLATDTCAGPVSKSHVIVRDYPEGEYPDAICTNPGCIYNGSNCE